MYYVLCTTGARSFNWLKQQKKKIGEYNESALGEHTKRLSQPCGGGQGKHRVEPHYFRLRICESIHISHLKSNNNNGINEDSGLFLTTHVCNSTKQVLSS